MKKFAIIGLLSLASLTVLPIQALPKYGQVRLYYSDPSMTRHVGTRTITYGWFNCTNFGVVTPYYMATTSDDCTE